MPYKGGTESPKSYGLPSQYIYQTVKPESSNVWSIFAWLCPKKSGRIKFTVHGALPKWPLIKFNPVWQSRQQALKAYCPDIYTVPTLQRNALEDAWGFSLIGGLDYLEAAGRYSGIVTQRGDVGLWLKVIPLLFLITCY